MDSTPRVLVERGIALAEVDGSPVDARAIPLLDDGGTHHVRLVLGDA